MNDDFLFNPHKDIAWQAVLNGLPTRAFLKSRGCSRLSLCPTVNCGEEETTRHCLWECAYAQTVWVSIRLWLPNLYRVPSEGDIWCGELEKVHCKKWIRWRTIINVFKEALMKSRNFCVFQKYEIPVKSVISLSLKYTGDYILRDGQKLSVNVIDELWSIPNVPPFNMVTRIGSFLEICVKDKG